MPQNSYLQVSIISPGGKVYETTEAKVVTAPSAAGEVSILPKHAPLFTKLNPGEITVKEEKDAHIFAVFGGFMYVNPDSQVTVLADFAQRSEKIDVDTAQKAKAEAERLMQHKEKYSKDEFARIELTLKQALFAIKIAEKSKRKKTI